jgi:hypothetical protein
VMSADAAVATSEAKATVNSSMRIMFSSLCVVE